MDEALLLRQSETPTTGRLSSLVAETTPWDCAKVVLVRSRSFLLTFKYEGKLAWALLTVGECLRARTLPEVQHTGDARAVNQEGSRRTGPLFRMLVPPVWEVCIRLRFAKYFCSHLCFSQRKSRSQTPEGIMHHLLYWGHRELVFVSPASCPFFWPAA